jgi:hypothetical protein
MQCLHDVRGQRALQRQRRDVHLRRRLDRRGLQHTHLGHHAPADHGVGYHASADHGEGCHAPADHAPADHGVGYHADADPSVPRRLCWGQLPRV